MHLSSEKLCAEIAQRLPGRAFRLETYDLLSSTNDRVRELACGDAPEYTLVAAGGQSSGRGTQGREFFSPADTGVYMSLLLRPAVLENPGRITVTAAVAVSRAVEKLFACRTQIKWVNDVYFAGKKVSGILAEGGIDPQCGAWVALGIGVNLIAPEGGFPESLRERAGALLPNGALASREALMAQILADFVELYENADDELLYEVYCARDMLRGNKVYIMLDGGETEALVLGIDRDFALRVRLPDGSEMPLRSSASLHLPEKTGLHNDWRF